MSHIVVVTKTSGELRICNDPKPLGRVLKRDYFAFPVFDAILVELLGVPYTKVGVVSTFCHSELDEAFSCLSMFYPPNGRCR